MEGTIALCLECGHSNPANQATCANCGKPLKPSTTPENVTYHLDDVPEVLEHPRWGTFQLGAQRKLILHIRGQARPLIVDLSDKIVLGRHDSESQSIPHINLDEYEAHQQGVSRRHALIFIEDEAVKVMDLNSANATQLNGQKLVPYQSRILRDGDELLLGKLAIRVNFI